MKNLRRLALGLLVGVVAGLVVTVGPVEATIAEEVPLGSGDFSAVDEGYVKIGKHFTKGHVDMNIGSVRLCGHFPLVQGAGGSCGVQLVPYRSLATAPCLASCPCA